jgi:hypothetical protein
MTGGDKAAFNDGGDRNLYVNSVTYDGTKITSAVTPIYQSPFFPPLNPGPIVLGNVVFKVTDTTVIPANAPSTPTTTPAAVSVGTGANTLNLSMAEDPYNGDAQFTVSVDGVQVGGTLTTTAVEYLGQTQQFVLHGSWGNGPHTVVVKFLNDLIGPADARGTYDSVDRNLLINGITYDGALVAGTPYELFNNGSHTFNVPTTTAPVAKLAAASAALPAATDTPMVVADNQANVTISQSNVSVLVTGGTHMLFISGTGDTVTLSGGRDTITDTGGGNSFVLPIAGQGYDTFTGTLTQNILTVGDTLDLRPALAATDWNGAASTLAKYLTVGDTAQGAVLSIAPTAGGIGVAVATIGGATSASFSDVLAHTLT